MIHSHIIALYSMELLSILMTFKIDSHCNQIDKEINKLSSSYPHEWIDEPFLSNCRGNCRQWRRCFSLLSAPFNLVLDMLQYCDRILYTIRGLCIYKPGYLAPHGYQMGGFVGNTRAHSKPDTDVVIHLSSQHLLSSFSSSSSHISSHLGITWQNSKDFHKSLIHLRSCPFEEPAAPSEEQSVPCEDCLVRVLGDVVADVSRSVARSEQALNVHSTNSKFVTMLDLPGYAVYPIIPTKHSKARDTFDKVSITSSMVPMVMSC